MDALRQVVPGATDRQVMDNAHVLESAAKYLLFLEAKAGGEGCRDEFLFKEKDNEC